MEQNSIHVREPQFSNESSFTVNQTYSAAEGESKLSVLFMDGSCDGRKFTSSGPAVCWCIPEFYRLLSVKEVEPQKVLYFFSLKQQRN